MYSSCMRQCSKSQAVPSFGLWLERYRFGTMLTFRCMVPVIDWRLKEEGETTWEGDIVYVKRYGVSIIFQNDTFRPFRLTWYEISNHGVHSWLSTCNHYCVNRVNCYIDHLSNSWYKILFCVGCHRQKILFHLSTNTWESLNLCTQVIAHRELFCHPQLFPRLLILWCLLSYHLCSPKLYEWAANVFPVPKQLLSFLFGNLSFKNKLRVASIVPWCLLSIFVRSPKHSSF